MTPRKPRKMPKNQRAYPKGKVRMTPITDPDELQRLMAYGPDDLGAPTLYKMGSDWAANTAELKKWRALRNPPTSTGEQ